MGIASDANDDLRERRLQALKEEIAGRTSELEASETRRRELEADLTQAEAARAQVEAVRSRVESERASVESELRVSLAVQQRLETDLQGTRAEVEQLQAALEEAEAVRGELVRRFGDVLSSTSWRVTSPLRKAVRRMRREPGEAEERGPV